VKISKDAARDARRIFRLCSPDGRLDEDKLRVAVKKIAEMKPRNYRAILHSIKRLVRLDLESRQALILSAIDLDTQSRVEIEKNLSAQYQEKLTFTYKTDPSLIGGIRIRVGNDVWDGSIQSRLTRLAESF